MLEVINGFLLIYFVILSFLSALVPQIVKPISAIFRNASNEDHKLIEEVTKLKEDQSTLSMKDDFAAYSRIQRKINKLEAEIKETSQTRIKQSLAIKGTVHLVLQGILGLTMVLSVIWYRREPIVVLKGDLFPLTTILRYPCQLPNAISTHVWVLITNFSVRTLIKPLTS